MTARMEGTVECIRAERHGAQEIDVRVGDEVRLAVNYPELSGAVAPGDRVQLNSWAVELELGTGGVDFVVWSSGIRQTVEPPGHLLKLRYSPLQFPILAAEAPESPHHDAIRECDSLDGIPVVCAELHSQIAAIAAGIKWETGHAARVAYVMTDGGALPLAFSRLVPTLQDCGLIDVTVTAGNAFGGDYEAVNLYSALITAKAAAQADVIIVCQGPGSAGTATPLAFSGIDQGIALNASASLGATAIAAVRLSFADPRPRHKGISHHTLTVLDRVALASVLVPIPRLERAEQLLLRASLEERGILDKHELVIVDAELGWADFEKSGINVTTMGRSMAEERTFFLAAFAAGLLAGQWTAGFASAWEEEPAS